MPRSILCSVLTTSTDLVQRRYEIIYNLVEILTLQFRCYREGAFKKRAGNEEQGKCDRRVTRSSHGPEELCGGGDREESDPSRSDPKHVR